MKIDKYVWREENSGKHCLSSVLTTELPCTENLSGEQWSMWAMTFVTQRLHRASHVVPVNTQIISTALYSHKEHSQSKYMKIQRYTVPVFKIKY